MLAPAWSPTLAALLASALCVGGTFMELTMAAMQQARLAGATAAEGVPLAASLVAAAVLLLGAAMLLPRGRTS